ncbi:MAG: methyl-accepting chemotaxis protein, partial [Lachnospiraceae bacterium]|nr:methyl-accepting chemotaxis protein [Lachnospiraceae bacterium]
EQISEIGSHLIRKSNVSVERMGSVEQNVGVQMNQLDGLNTMFGGLGKEIDKVSGAAGNISEQTKQITAMKDEISNIIEQLAAISEENAASTQETSASMQDLSCAIDECTAGTDKLLNLSDELSRKAKDFRL